MNKIKIFLASKKFLTILSFIGLYLFSTGTSWAVFTLVLDRSPDINLSGGLEDVRSRINLDLPRTEECPLNGGMFTKIEQNIWEDRRPIAAMIENHEDSR